MQGPEAAAGRKGRNSGQDQQAVGCERVEVPCTAQPQQAAHCSGLLRFPFPHLSCLEKPGARTHQQEKRETNNDLK